MPATVCRVCRWEWGCMRCSGLCSTIWLAQAFVWISHAPWYSSSLGVSFPPTGGWFPRGRGVAGADSVSEPISEAYGGRSPVTRLLLATVCTCPRLLYFWLEHPRHHSSPGNLRSAWWCPCASLIPFLSSAVSVVLQGPGDRADGTFRLPGTFKKYISCYHGNCILNRIFL